MSRNIVYKTEVAFLSLTFFLNFSLGSNPIFASLILKNKRLI